MKYIKTLVGYYKQIYTYRVLQLSSKPRLAIIQVGDNEASNRYVRNKEKDCREVNIECKIFKLEEDILEEELLKYVINIQNDCDGIIVQLPLPPHIDEKKVIAAIRPEKDVDGFHPNSEFKPATPKGIMDYLVMSDFPVAGKLVVIIGRSEIVGKPLAKMMTDANATVVLCHSYTKEEDLKKLISLADLVVCAVGKAKFLDCSEINCPVIDVGINFDENGKLVGDCYNTEGKEVTPVPGGVGLLTRCALLDNVITAAEKKI